MASISFEFGQAPGPHLWIAHDGNPCPWPGLGLASQSETTKVGSHPTGLNFPQCAAAELAWALLGGAGEVPLSDAIPHGLAEV